MLSKILRNRNTNDGRDAPDNTRSIARNRLSAALGRDRYDLLSPTVVDSLERDMYAAISRHLEVDGQFNELEIRRMNDSFYLVASVRIQALPRWAAVG